MYSTSFYTKEMRILAVVLLLVALYALVMPIEAAFNCGVDIVWFNGYYGWGQKYKYGALVVQNPSTTYKRFVLDYNHPTYGQNTVSAETDPWRMANGVAYKFFYVSKSDDGKNYPMAVKVLSDCGDLIYTSPASYSFCFFVYSEGSCPMGNYSPYTK
jgi:hypothetical protein